MGLRMVRWVGFVVALVLGTGCESVKSVLGLDHKGPNEFKVMPLAPLSLPSSDHKTPSQEKEEEAKKKQESAAKKMALTPVEPSAEEKSATFQKALESHSSLPPTQEAQKAAELLLTAKETPLEATTTSPEPQSAPKSNSPHLAEKSSPSKLATQESPSPEPKPLEQVHSSKVTLTAQPHSVAKLSPKPEIQVDTTPAPELEDPPSCLKEKENDDEDEVENWTPGDKDLHEQLPPSVWENASTADLEKARPVLTSVETFSKATEGFVPPSPPLPQAEVQTPQIRVESVEIDLDETNPKEKKPATITVTTVTTKKTFSKDLGWESSLHRPAHPKTKVANADIKSVPSLPLKQNTRRSNWASIPSSVQTANFSAPPPETKTVKRQRVRRYKPRKRRIRVVKKERPTVTKRRRVRRRRLVRVIAIKQASTPTPSSTG